MIKGDEQKDFPVTGPMRSCKLIVLNETSMGRKYKVEVHAIRAGDESLKKEIVEEFVTSNPKDVYVYLSKCGVPVSEVQTAAVHLDELGHNAAYFGWYGSFIFSKFEGTLQ